MKFGFLDLNVVIIAIFLRFKVKNRLMSQLCHLPLASLHIKHIKFSSFQPKNLVFWSRTLFDDDGGPPKGHWISFCHTIIPISGLCWWLVCSFVCSSRRPRKMTELCRRLVVVVVCAAHVCILSSFHQENEKNLWKIYSKHTTNTLHTIMHRTVFFVSVCLSLTLSSSFVAFWHTIRCRWRAPSWMASVGRWVQMVAGVPLVVVVLKISKMKMMHWNNKKK